MTEPLPAATIEELESYDSVERDEDNGGPECRRCHDLYTVRPGDDVTPLCNNCAHEVIRDCLPQLLAAARRVAGLERELAAVKAFDTLVRMRVADIAMESFDANTTDAQWLADAAWERATRQTEAARPSEAEGGGR